MLLFMLLPALHLVNLNIGRIEERTSEIGVRKSFGASTPTLVGQFVAENVLLTLIGRGLQPAAQLGHSRTGFPGRPGLPGCRGTAPHLLLRGTARPVLRHRLRGLAGLEDGAPASLSRR